MSLPSPGKSPSLGIIREHVGDHSKARLVIDLRQPFGAHDLIRGPSRCEISRTRPASIGCSPLLEERDEAAAARRETRRGGTATIFVHSSRGPRERQSDASVGAAADRLFEYREPGATASASRHRLRSA